MSSGSADMVDECVPETPMANARKRMHGSVTNLHSQKRRRLSSTSVDFSGLLDIDAGLNKLQHASSVDRFVSSRPKMFLPLNTTPRTQRISKQFGLTDEKVLNFRGDTRVGSSSRRDENTVDLLRRSASSLFQKSPAIHPASVMENLSKRKDCLAILDSPGVSKDPDAYPISWSDRNFIAVVCMFDIFYQNIETKSVSQLCRSFSGLTNAIQWGGKGFETYLAGGNNRGMVIIWDVGTGTRGKLLRNWYGTPFDPIRSLSWNDNMFAAGADSGELSLIDVRDTDKASTIKLHDSPVVGLQWSADGLYLASGDKNGIVHIWDQRAGKSLLDTTETMKLRHRGSAKALAWCPWKRDLLATGSTAPEGKIRIWSTSSFSSSVAPAPLETIPLNTSVTSLHWSPHCKELLSTHGSSFAPILQSRNQNTSSAAAAAAAAAAPKLAYKKTPLANSITVHQYPSCKRLMTLSNAHSSVVTHSCLGPSGDTVFTVCPKEETIKMWKVWNPAKPADKKESAFDKYAIR